MAHPISPDGTPIEVLPIQPDELDRIPLRCWPDRAEIDSLFAAQGTIGMEAWDGDKCDGEPHGYRLVLPEWNQYPPDPEWWADATRVAGLELSGNAWAQACCHVGKDAR